MNRALLLLICFTIMAWWMVWSLGSSYVNGGCLRFILVNSNFMQWSLWLGFMLMKGLLKLDCTRAYACGPCWMISSSPITVSWTQNTSEQLLEFHPMYPGSMKGLRNAFRGALWERTLGILEQWEVLLLFPNKMGGCSFKLLSGYWSRIAHDSYMWPKAWLIECP